MPHIPHSLRAPLLGAAILLGAACTPESETAVIWTDRPAFALYAEQFNAGQRRHKVEIRYFPSPAGRLAAARQYPDIAVGSWLKSAATRTLFSPLDTLLRDGAIRAEDFYPRLLSLGNIDGRQYLLPVAFNIPAVIFARDKTELLSNPFTIGFAEMKTLGKAYNAERNGVYSRMGFSPAWDDRFLFIMASLSGASFREAAPAAWDAAALEKALAYAAEWTETANGGADAEEDFTFKYFYEPPAKLAISGRILFTYMDSADYFTLAPERRAALDFRWIAEDDVIPLIEDTVYYGVCKKGKAKRAAEAFTRWFFDTDTQRRILEKARSDRLIETSFGVAGGFSAMREVTETVFPRFYPQLLDHMPPDDFLSPPNILPENWETLKEQIILPYLRERVRKGGDILPLERRVADWTRLNRSERP